MKFSELGLSNSLLKATDYLGYEIATPIQAQTIPLILSGSDLMGCAQTGTGKTAAYTLPLLDLLERNQPEQPAPAPTPAAPAPAQEQRYDRSRRYGRNAPPQTPSRPLRAVILSPTRELAAQIGESLKKYGLYTSLRYSCIFGGVSQVPQVKALRYGVDVVVATPGRLIDLMDQRLIDLSDVSMLVLDEADQMLDMGFLPALKRIISQLPAKRQTLMFSATMPPAIQTLAQQWLKKPEHIKVSAVSAPAARIEQTVYMVDRNHKAVLLSNFLKDTPRSRTVIFSRTNRGADMIAKRLEKDGLPATAIHGDKSQRERTRAIEQFKGDNAPILVATDIAARGLDIRDVSHIVNYDLPDTPETYVHRIGRTGRAGAEGVAITLCAPDERRILRQIEKLIQQRINVDGQPEGQEPAPRSYSGPRSYSNGGNTNRSSSFRGGSNRDSSNRDSSNRDSSNRDSSNRDSSNRDSSNRDSSNRDSSNRGGSQQPSNSNGGKSNSFDRDDRRPKFYTKSKKTKTFSGKQRRKLNEIRATK